MYATKGPVEFDGASPLPPPHVRRGIPTPVRATGTRGDGPDTATAAANVPSTTSPTPTNASTRLTVIDHPRSNRERKENLS